ncbi:MAG: LysM peptidoglycan-binding domain-containing protein [Nitriliruptorales bacterium]|nr:LysM peptidoglycan-binding domain-containing protein [Nitriliruptorales bacterium]
MALIQQARRRTATRALVGIATAAALVLSGSAGYTVRAGDTLWGIASRQGVSLSSLISANALSNPDLIRPGQQLRLPGGARAASGTSSVAGGAVHVVAPGETLMGISIRYGVTMRRIARANGIADLNWVYAGQRLRIPSAAAPSPARSVQAPAMAAPRADVGRMLEETAQRYGFKPSFIKAIAYQESGWNQAARSSAGAVGVMQVLPSTGEFVSRYVVGRRLNLRNTQDNITAGVAFVDYLWKLTGGNVRRTLAGYYQGLRSVRKNGMYPSTKRYIANILALRSRFT